MVIRFLDLRLEQLSELEEKIAFLERMMDELNIDYDREKMIRTLLAGQLSTADQKKKKF